MTRARRKGDETGLTADSELSLSPRDTIVEKLNFMGAFSKLKKFFYAIFSNVVKMSIVSINQSQRPLINRHLSVLQLFNCSDLKSVSHTSVPESHCECENF